MGIRQTSLVDLTFLKKSRQQIPTFIIVCNAAGHIEEEDDQAEHDFRRSRPVV